MSCPRFPKGITPAGAGKTVGLLEDLAGAEDHPRRCGENEVFKRLSDGKIGSPPQVRGKPSNVEENTVLSRITPAGAGKTVIGFSYMQ